MGTLGKRAFPFLLIIILLLTVAAPMAAADDLLVTFPGDYAEAAGLGGNWAPDNLNTQANDDNRDGVWVFVTDAIPAGSYEFKAAVGGTWDESYPSSNVPFTVANAGDAVHFYYDRSDNTVASRPDAIIPVVVGDFLSAIGGQDWSPDNLFSWMKDADGDGIYRWEATVPAGDWEYKVALNESWDEAYPADNRMFTVPEGGDIVTFTYDSASNEVSETVGAEPLPPLDYAVMRYHRPAGDYGDPTSGDFNDYWGLHLWGDGLDPSEGVAWTSPKPFAGIDDYGAYVAVKLSDSGLPLNYIIHKGNEKDTPNDRSFVPDAIPMLWMTQGDDANYASRAAASGMTVIHYQRPDGDYDGWGLHLWGNGLAPGEGTDWSDPKLPDGFDDYGAYFEIALSDATQPVNFIVHEGDDKDPDADRSYTPAQNYAIWLMSGEAEIYTQRGAAEDFALIHYRRSNGDYDGWGLHVWEDSAEEGVTWDNPLPPAGQDDFGIFWKVRLTENPERLGFIVHKGDEKDPGPDEFMVFADTGFEIWKIQGSGDMFPEPAIPTAVLDRQSVGDLGKQQAYWVDESTIAWAAAADTDGAYTLHYDANAGLTLGGDGINGGSSISLTPDPAGLSDAVKAKFPYIADLPALKIDDLDLPLVPDILKSQFAVEAKDNGGNLQDATGLQIPGVLDDLYTYDGELGVVWSGDVPSFKLWAPTAQWVKLHLFTDSDPATPATVYDMAGDAATGVWSIEGESAWKDQFYVYEVRVFAPATGQIEQNFVTDPYSLSLAQNSTRSQIVDLSDPMLAPDGWETLAKPELAAPEDITIYELHMRDFSANDATVPDELKGTYKAFTLEDTNGVKHLQALQEAGLTHLHLLPTFDIATIDEDKANWQEPDFSDADMSPDSEDQQAAVVAVEDLDAFNWGYDPYHYTVPEGSYSTDPDGSARIVEYREMVQALNEMGLRLVMDVVYNHTNSAGQNPKSVLDKIVPSYYHRLDADGQVETSTCCQNTASEHNMMEKLMIDSLVTWARDYKIDAFRFDLMGHHMVSNMEHIRAALDALTLENDGVDGKSIYLYGEGWNFGEVANNARGVNATQLNVGGLGIGTFNDRLRDAVRGASPFASGEDLKDQGFADGLYFDPNGSDQGAPDEQLERLLLFSDQIRVGMAGNLADYAFIDRNGDPTTGKDVDYNGQPAGYTLDPQEDITYVSKHDNQTLYDIYAYGIPAGTSMADRVRVQNVALSTVLLGEGVPFLHAGSDLLRSKSLDRDSFNSGDWFNKLDFTYQDNNFGVGLPVAGKNQENWDIMRPLLADPDLKPAPADIAFSRDLFQELLRIRYSSPLFRLQTFRDVQSRLAFHNTGPDQLPGLIVMTLTDVGVPDIDPDYELVVVLINANDEAQTFDSDLAGRQLMLHPVQQASVDTVVQGSTFDSGSGQFSIPARTAAVFVEKQLGADDLVTFPGSYVATLGGADWDPADETTRANDDNDDGVWKFASEAIPAGSYEFKATVGGSWGEAYPANNVSFTVPEGGGYTAFYYDRSDNYVASRPDAIIPVVAGSFGDEIGGADWTPANLSTWMKDKDGDGVYTFSTIAIPPGDWEYKVALNEGWDEAYPADNLTFTVPEGGARVTFSYDGASHEVSEEVSPLVGGPPPSELLVTFPGDYPEAAGLGGNWAPDNLNTQANDDNGDGVWVFVTDSIPAGSYQFKAAVGGSWDENYGVNGVPGGDNVTFTQANDGDTVHFYYDRSDNFVASRPDYRIPVLVGDLMEAVGGSNWSPDNLKGWMKDPDGDQIYEITLDLPAGDFQYKVALNESWDENYPADNISLTVPAGGMAVTFTYDDVTHGITDSTQGPEPEPPVVVKLPLLADTWVNGGSTMTNYYWYAAMIVRSTGFDNGLFVFDRSALPVGAEVISATLTVTATFQSGQFGKEMQVLNTDPFDPTTVTYDTAPVYHNPSASLPVPDDLGQIIFDIPGQITAWDANGPVSDKGYLALSMTGPWGRVAMDNLGSWPPGNQASLVVSYTKGTGVSLEDLELVSEPVQNPIQDEVMYFVMTDRMDNGDPGNDYGDDPGGDTDDDIRRHGFRPDDKSFYHGGDLAGLMGKLDYLQNMGVTALWITPPYVNRPTQPDSSTDLGVGAAYHGYWILDYENADPHLGASQELKDLVAAAHERGIKVFFDIVVNHTADVISYAEGEYSYRNKTDYPYRDAGGTVFDDRDYAGGDTFPTLDAATSFPYTPTLGDPQFAEAKNPDWLDNPIYYHNRGNSTFAGESSLYGDFFGLDDTFTEHPDVVNGYIDIFKWLIDEYDIDGYRIDTVKHVNMELWQALSPEIMVYAGDQGKEDFFMFGEVFSGDAAFRSQYTTIGRLPAVLDFGLQGAANGFANGGSADSLRGVFESDDYFTDPDSNAYQTPNFVSNHDIGRLGHDVQSDNAGASDAEWVQRETLGYGLIYFARGFPIVYYGDEQGFVGGGSDKLSREDMMPSLVPEYNANDLIGTDATTADANFDPTHPLYQTLADYAGVLQAHKALRRGAQIHRYSSSGAGIYAFSRIDRDQQIEYVVALNNAGSAQSATFPTFSPDTTFEPVYPAGAPALTSDGDGVLTVEAPALALVIYKAGSPIPTSASAPTIRITTPEMGAEVNGQFEIGAEVQGNRFVEVTFAVSVDGGDFSVIGVDTNPPYRVFYDSEGLATNTALTFKAIVNDLQGHYSAAESNAVVVLPASYAFIHYNRPGGDYDGWGLHLWGDGLDPSEITDWGAPKQWNGEDEYGMFAYIKVLDPAQPIGFIVHKGDDKDTDGDRSFTPTDARQTWIKQGDPGQYGTPAAANGSVVIHYQRSGDDYDGWGLHLWGDAIDPSEATDWANPKLPDGFDDYGAYFDILLQDSSQAVNFIVHKGDDKDTDADRSFVPDQTGDVWLKQGDAEVYKQRGAAEDFALLHYHRLEGDYGDYSSDDYNDYWGLHTWGDADDPGWTTPRKPVSEDAFGVVFKVDLHENAQSIGYLLHRGDEKDPGPDQALEFGRWGYEVWQLQGADVDAPYILP